MKLLSKKFAFLSLNRLPAWAWMYITSGAGEKSIVSGTRPKETLKMYLLMVGGAKLTAMVG